MDNAERKTNRRLLLCLVLLLAATLFINILSSYIRHLEAGLGCEPWPACYGVVGELVQANTAEAVAGLALAPTAVAKRLHRTVATILVVLVLLVSFQARQQLPAHGRALFLPYLLIAVVLLLAVVGPASYLKTLPAIASVNLLGGVALLSLSWLLWLEALSASSPDHTSSGKTVSVTRSYQRLGTCALAVLIVQISLGVWVSANFAGAACSGVLDCVEPDVAQSSPWGSFWYFRELALNEAGAVIVDTSQVIIHVAHRAGAIIVALVLGAYAVLSLRQGGGFVFWGRILLGLLVLQLVFGGVAVTGNLPLVVVLGHNLIASLLLLTVLRLRYPPLQRVQEGAS